MKKLLIDLMKCRECTHDCILCEEYEQNRTKGFRNLIEQALYTVTCRQCEDSPCINVCPQEALEKNAEGMVKRNSNLCVGCKSCALACPFGTIPNYLVDYVIKKDNIQKINKEEDLKSLMKKCPDKALQITDQDASEEEYIYRITDQILVKDHKWEEFVK